MGKLNEYGFRETDLEVLQKGVPVYTISVPQFTLATNRRDTTEALSEWIDPIAAESSVKLDWHYDYSLYLEGMIIVCAIGSHDELQEVVRALRQGCLPGWRLTFGFPHVNVVYREEVYDQ